MSKKQAKSERNIELPDWADEVTPADEVMRKFYAPTGAFKPGPIVVRPPAPAEPAPAATPDEPRVEEPAPADVATAEAPAPEQAPLPEAPEQTAPVTTREEEQPTSLPRSPRPPKKVPAAERTPSEEPFPPAPTTPPAAASTSPPASAQALSFEEFAKRWRKYLYPGQLAVMRTLFDLTIALGETECFTRYSEIAAVTKMTRRNCINVMNSLVERGFVERLEVRNDATGKGIRLRVHSEPLF